MFVRKYLCNDNIQMNGSYGHGHTIMRYHTDIWYQSSAHRLEYQGRPQWGGRGGTGHPWDFNISETGDTIHQIRWHTWAWVKTQSLKSDLIQTNYFPILLAILNVFVNIQFSALFDL